MKKINKLIILLTVILFPQTVLANAGTTLMWMPIFQLMFGNILIGLIEGLIVSAFYKTKWYRSILLMVAGNYASWLIGNGLIVLFQEYFIETIFNLKGVFAAWIISLIILYFFTVIIEVPFFNWTFSKGTRKWKRSWKLSFIVNVFTYTVMIFVYLNVSKYNFFTELKVNQSLLDKKYDFELFLKEDNDVIKGRFSKDFKGEIVYHIPDEYEYLHFAVSENTHKGTFELILADYNGDTLIVQNSFIDDSEKSNYPQLTEKYSWIKSDFRDTTDRNWKASAGGWAIEGLTITNENKTKENYAFEVPWMFWGIGQVSIINENELVCKIYGRLILLNKDTREIAYITKSNDYILKKLK